MKTTTISIVLLLLSPIVFAQSETQFKEEALKILTPIKKAFMKELRTGLKEGPYETVDSCHLKAPHIIESDYHQTYELGRTSDKIRNKNNSPQAWLEPILKEYIGSHIEKPVEAKVFKVKNKFAYVEPIYTSAVCLKCHGDLHGSVKKKIEALYPKDMATGYKIGEFRGLFYIKQK